MVSRMRETEAARRALIAEFHARRLNRLRQRKFRAGVPRRLVRRKTERVGRKTERVGKPSLSAAEKRARHTAACRRWRVRNRAQQNLYMKERRGNPVFRARNMAACRAWRARKKEMK